MHGSAVDVDVNRDCAFQTLRQFAFDARMAWFGLGWRSLTWHALLVEAWPDQATPGQASPGQANAGQSFCGRQVPTNTRLLIIATHELVTSN